jgi:GTPase SAR1 family protein
MQKSISDKIPEISIVIVGDSQCGKTQLISRFDNKYFSKVSFAYILLLLEYANQLTYFIVDEFLFFLSHLVISVTCLV